MIQTIAFSRQVYEKRQFSTTG